MTPDVVFGAGACYTIPVRGDSLRDLYAKTLALLGLGMLAGVGALVDYWPAGITLPRVASALRVPAPAASQHHDVDVPAIAAPRTVTVAARRVAPVPVASGPALLSLPAEGHAGAPLGTTLSLTDPAPAVLLASAIPVVDDRAAVMALAMVEDVEFAPDALQDVPAAQTAVQQVSVDEGDGFLTGAFKKTGSSIVKTSVRTGASIFDAVRVVGGVVRRALPN